MWFGPLHTTAFVKIHILAANIGPTQFSCLPSSSSHPPFLSITAMAYENSAFVWMALSKSNLSSTKDTQNCFTTFSLVRFALAPKILRVAQLFLCFHQKSLFSSRSAALIGGTLYTCPPITGSGSKCQNIALQLLPKTRAAETRAASVIRARRPRDR